MNNEIEKVAYELVKYISENNLSVKDALEVLDRAKTVMLFNSKCNLDLKNKS